MSTWRKHEYCISNLRLYGQAARIISIGKLNTLLCLHIQPINDLVWIVPLEDL